jgi:hypothetical protein
MTPVAHGRIRTRGATLLGRARSLALRAALVVVFTGAALFAAAFLLGPLAPAPPALQLLALDPAGGFSSAVSIPIEVVEAPEAGTGAARAPLLLAVYNAGPLDARPRSLELSVPARVRVLDAAGRPLPRRRDAGNPLGHYRLPLGGERIAPEGVPVVLPGFERLWLEPFVSPWRCALDADDVPEFVPAPARDPALQGMLRIYYSLAEAPGRARATGVLSVDLDPALFAIDTVPTPPRFPPTIGDGDAAPDVGALRRRGTRTVECGEEDVPLEIESTLFETQAGGRVFAIAVGGRVRKYLLDLNGDSIVEAEVWDGDGDAAFELQRRARFPIPEFLFPLREPEPQPQTQPVPEPAGAAQLERRGTASDRPDTARTPPAAPPDTAPRRPAAGPAPPARDTIRADTLRADTLRADTLRADTLRADTLRADTLRADTLRADTLRADTLRADTLRADTLRAVALRVRRLQGVRVEARTGGARTTSPAAPRSPSREGGQ